jgi:hypothetical protein
VKKFFRFVFIVSTVFWARTAFGHFTGAGHVHTVSEAKQVYLNSDCRSTGTCDLKRFTLTTLVYEVWFSDDPNYPTHSNSAIMEYETDTVNALEKYAIVQFKRGCVFYSSKTRDGEIRRNIGDSITSFGASIPFCFRQWVIDSQDSDPAYNSDPENGRFYLLRWNPSGSHDEETQKFYGAEKPAVPVVYMVDHPAGAFVTGSGARNVALQFITCIYKAADVPTEARRNDLNFATPIACLDWQNIYVYDFNKQTFRTDLAAVPTWQRPTPPVDPHLFVLLGALLIALIASLRLGERRRELAANLTPD